MHFMMYNMKYGKVSSGFLSVLRRKKLKPHTIDFLLGRWEGRGTWHPKGCTGNNPKPNREMWVMKTAKLLEKIQEDRLKIGTEGKWGETEIKRKNKKRKKSFKTRKENLERIAWSWKALEVATPPALQVGIHLCGPQKRQSNTPPLSHNQHSLPPVFTLCINVQLCGELNSEAIHL